VELRVPQQTEKKFVLSYTAYIWGSIVYKHDIRFMLESAREMLWYDLTDLKASPMIMNSVISFTLRCHVKHFQLIEI